MSKSILRNYFLINLVLLAVIVFLGAEFYKVYSRKWDIPPEPPVRQAGKEDKAAEDAARPADPAMFQIIADMDIFRPARSPYREEAAQPSVPKIPPRLFGTIIFGGEKSAILEDPNSKSTRTYRINENIGGFVVSEIMEDKVVLTFNGEKSEVRLREEKKGLPVIKPMVALPPQMQQQQVQPQQQAQPQVQTQTETAQRPVPQRPVRQRRIPQRPVPGQPGGNP